MKDCKTLTVFTPTYNRAHTLYLGYEALLRQTCKDFVWLIVDDGSTDNTQTMVKEWMKADNPFAIRYYYKENGGLHTCYNTAIELSNTELFVCIDSDDYMPDNAVSLILDYWRKNDIQEYAGIIGLDFYENGKPIGGLLPSVRSVFLPELTCKYNYKGDTKMVVKTSLLKEVFPMPTYNQEKNFNPIYLLLQIGDKQPFLLLNENLCYVKYDAEGMSSHIMSQYRNSPNSFRALRLLNMDLFHTTSSFRFKQHIHYVSSCLIAKRMDILSESPHKLLTLLAFPFGFMLCCYILWKTR